MDAGYPPQRLSLRSFLRRHLLAWWLLPLSLWLTFQYRWVLDDAFIYFRYAENFRQTGQLVFNRDEYVEGFTSPLWMLLLTGTRLLGLPFWPVIVGIVGLSLVSVVASVLHGLQFFG